MSSPTWQIFSLGLQLFPIGRFGHVGSDLLNVTEISITDLQQAMLQKPSRRSQNLRESNCFSICGVLICFWFDHIWSISARLLLKASQNWFSITTRSHTSDPEPDSPSTKSNEPRDEAKIHAPQARFRASNSGTARVTVGFVFCLAANPPKKIWRFGAFDTVKGKKSPVGLKQPSETWG